MTFTRFFGLGFLLWILLSALKILVLKVFGFDSTTVQLLYGFFTFVFAMACVRRLGVINYLEALMTAVFWAIGMLVADFFFLRLLLGMEIFEHWEFWLGYFVAIVAIFFFNKKRHVQIRKELAAHHVHSQGGGHGGQH